MARFLIVAPPLVGHINPTIAVGSELARRGHEVTWCGYPSPLADLLAPGASMVAVGAAVPDELARASEASLGARGVVALKFLWEGFIIPLARAMVPGVEAAVAELEPDVVVVDQQAPAGAIVARRHGLPWATSASTPAELLDPFAGMPKIGAWITDQLVGLQVEHGIDEARAAEVDLRFSDRLLMAFTTETFLGGRGEFPDHWRFVGPSLGERVEPTGFPLEWFDPDRQQVLVSLGTINAEIGGRFFSVTRDALADLAVKAVMVAPPASVGAVPANVLVRPWIPQVGLLPHFDAVVCHGGYNTVCEALAHGLPLVVAPVRDDQPLIADLVERAGAGIRVKFGRAGVADVRAAVSAVLDDDRYRRQAATVGRSFATAGGAAAAAGHLERLYEERFVGRSVSARRRP